MQRSARIVWSWCFCGFLMVCQTEVASAMGNDQQGPGNTPAVCGNGVVEGAEVCDTVGTDCAGLGSSAMVAGEAPCLADCSGYDVSVCRIKFEDLDIDTNPDKPAHMTVADLDGDGALEIIVSVFSGSSPLGSGYVNIYKMTTPGDLRTWTKKRLDQSNGIKFPNGANVQDVDGDGDLDIILASGFLACTPGSCGDLSWFEKTASGYVKHTLVTQGKRFFHHAEWVDFDGDGIKDLVTVAEEKGFSGDGSAEVQVFLGNTTADRFNKQPISLGSGLGSFPRVLDLDGDGDLDIASAEYFGSKGSFAWLENLGAGKWTKRYIDATAGKSIQLSFVDNLLGDGKLVAVGASHTNTVDNPKDGPSAVYVYTIPADVKSLWPRVQISEGMVSVKSPMMGKMGAPGVFSVGDVDGDKDLDVVVHGDGDPRVFWLEQLPGGKFATHVIATDMSQGGVAVADFDGDGIDEIVASSYDRNRLRLIKVVAP